MRLHPGVTPLLGAALSVVLHTTACSSTPSDPGPSIHPTSSSAPTSPDAVSASPEIATSELDGRILFSRGGGKYGDETLFTANADGTNVQRITDFGVTCCAQWTPDGEHILISALSPDDRITTGIIEPDGSNLQTIPLPSGGLNLGCAEAFSEATGQLGCEGWSDDDPTAGGAYIIDGLAGGGVTRVTSAEGDIPFAFSAEGSRLFLFRVDDAMPNTIDEPVGSLFVVDTDGTHLERITPPDMPVQKTGTPGGRLSPDGQWIVFPSSGSIWKIRTDGSELTEVFADADAGYAVTPTWSPDGRFIMFALGPPGIAPTLDIAPASGLYVVRGDGTDLTPILGTDDWNKEPDWIAD